MRLPAGGGEMTPPLSPPLEAPRKRPSTVVTVTVGKRQRPSPSPVPSVPLREEDVGGSQATFELGNEYSRKGYFQKAVEAYKRVLRHKPKSFAVHFNLGFAYGRLGNAKQTYEHFKQATRLKRDDADAHYCLALPTILLGRLDEARKALHKAVTYQNRLSEYAQGQLGWMHFVLGWSFLRLSQKQSNEESLHSLNLAEELFIKSIELHARDCEPLYSLGVVYYELGRRREGEERSHLFEKSISFYQEATEADPTYSRVHNDLGVVYSTIGDTERATAAYEKAVEVDPNNVAALHNLGSAYLIADKWEAGLEIFDKARKINAQDLEALNGIGAASAALGRLDEGEEALTEAIRIAPDSINAHINLGIIFFKREVFEEAKSYFIKALELDPANTAAQRNLQILLDELLEKRLSEMGYLEELPKPITDFTQYEQRVPVELQGKPISEIIVEDRR